MVRLNKTGGAFLALLLLGIGAYAVAQEFGHEPNRVFIDQSGNFNLNGAAFYDDANNDISGSLEVLDDVSATELGYLDGLTPGTATASKAVVLGSSKEIATITTATITTLTSTTADIGTVTAASLIIESLNPMTLKFNDTDGLQLDNAAIATFAAATDTVGSDVFIETEDAGGTATAVTPGR